MIPPMTTRPIIPDRLRSYYTDWHMSPGLASGGFVFMTGFSGCGPDGYVPPDPEAQFREAFDQVGMVLQEAGLTFAHVVEMTSYHVGLQDHLALFREVRDEHIAEPYPAWTAIEVSGFVTPGVIIELRVIAREG